MGTIWDPSLHIHNHVHPTRLLEGDSMESAIRLGGEADIAKVDPRERREHSAISDWRIGPVIFLVLLDT